jgi:phosphatidylserine/phosphatidylglycerophosphate/cardiolipin synthase-like enzyme
MNTGIWRAIADIGIEFHPDRVNVIAKNIASMASVSEFSKVKNGFGQLENNPIIVTLEKEWKNEPGITPLEIAAALRGASGTAAIMEKREAVEMVWTGPFTGLVASRHTEQVLLEVINSSRLQLFIVSFVAYSINSIRNALHDAICRNVKISILLESNKEHGGKIDFDSIKLFKESLPSATIYCWNNDSKDTTQLHGAVHAKCVVADGELAFITSANLTKAALDNNMELGILVRGGNLPEQLEKHLHALVATGVIAKI